MTMFQETREYVKKLGLPSGDLWDMPDSPLRFPDGAAFRIECPTVNSAEAVGALLDTATKNNITINRITETYGMFRHTRAKIIRLARQGLGISAIARQLHVSRPTVRLWVQRFNTGGIEGLHKKGDRSVALRLVPDAKKKRVDFEIIEINTRVFDLEAHHSVLLLGTEEGL